MKTYRNLYHELCSYPNLYRAYKKARKGKTLIPYVIEFEKNLKENLLQLRADMLFHSYYPQPLKTFIIRDPKTRKISKSEFRDRIVHHALVNILEPIYERIFIYDSYANRKGKGTLAAINRFEQFKIKIAHFWKGAYCLKADIKHYFDTVDHRILLEIISRKIKDTQSMFLIKKILANHSNPKGMPLGNLTSQFFANIYLNELDQFIKQNLRAKYYIRYVDDFVILDWDKSKLENYKQEINRFLMQRLALGLHSTKSKIIPLHAGINFLGFRIFRYHKLLRKSNLRRIKKKPMLLYEQFITQKITYDNVYDSMLGSCAHARHANTYNLLRRIAKTYNSLFSNNIPTFEIDRWLKNNRRQGIL